jgi:uncharacterized protein
MVRFINRSIELSVLQKDYITQKNGFIVVYGRRRIGKTRLIQEFLKDKEGIRFTASDTSNVIQIRELKNIFANFLNDVFLKKQEILDWKSFFLYINQSFPKNKKCYIWIDEFSYLIKNDSSLASVIQEFIDNFLRNSNIFFIVSGSLFGLMTEKVLSHSSPLYGRRTRDILLTRLDFKYLNEFVNFSFEDVLKLEFTIGGIAEYLLISRNYNNYEDFIKNEFLLKEGYFFREVFFLLSQEFKEIKTYFSIINAIAYGNTKPTDIANFVGILSKEIYPYLELLINYGFVKREVSIIGNKKSGLYYINDNFLDFWFNFVNKNRDNIEKNIFKINKSDLTSYFGKRFEIFIRNNFHLFFNQFLLSGRFWYKNNEIDIVAINDKEILFCECKYQDNVDAEKIYNELKEKSKHVKWNNENRIEHFAIFAKSFKNKIKKENLILYDLKDIEKMLKKKTN